VPDCSQVISSRINVHETRNETHKHEVLALSTSNQSIDKFNKKLLTRIMLRTDISDTMQINSATITDHYF
jgi:hypothetical protein